MQRNDAYPVSAATIRKYIDLGILQGEKIITGNKSTYFVHIRNGTNNSEDDQFQTIVKG